MADVGIPVWPCEHFYLLTKPVAGIQGNMPTLSDHDASLYIRDDSGGLLVGCFEPMGKAIDPDKLGEDFAFGLLEEDWDHFEPMMQNALHRLPVLADCEVKMLLNGPESFTPDGSFLLGETAETQGLFLGCGMNSVGVATGGGAGMALAHCIQHGRPPMDLHEADPQRFPDCFNSVSALATRVPEVLGKHYEITYPGRQWTTSRHLQQLPLHERWQQAGAYFTQVYGYERAQYFGCDKYPELQQPVLTFAKPPWFEQVGREVKQAHEATALFDQSSFGKIDVTGSDACAFLNRVCANQMDRAPGRAIYTAMLNDVLYAAGARPAGLLAQTAMRIEKGFLSYGHDLDTDISPLEAGLDFVVDWDTDFIGREALLKQKNTALKQRIVSILLDDIASVPLGNEPVIYDGKMCGKTTSTAFGYRVRRPVALALVANEILPDTDADIAVEIDIAGELFSGRLKLGAAFEPKIRSKPA